MADMSCLKKWRCTSQVDVCHVSKVAWKSSMEVYQSKGILLGMPDFINVEAHLDLRGQNMVEQNVCQLDWICQDSLRCKTQGRQCLGNSSISGRKEGDGRCRAVQNLCRAYTLSMSRARMEFAILERKSQSL